MGRRDRGSRMGRATSTRGGDPQTTNNRMEITAAIEALRALAAGVQSDPAQRQPVPGQVDERRLAANENLDLWKELDAEVARARRALPVGARTRRRRAQRGGRRAGARGGRAAGGSAASGRAPRRPGAAGADAGAAAAAPRIWRPPGRGSPRTARRAASRRMTTRAPWPSCCRCSATASGVARCAACGRSFVARDAPASGWRRRRGALLRARRLPARSAERSERAESARVRSARARHARARARARDATRVAKPLARKSVLEDQLLAAAERSAISLSSSARRRGSTSS